METKITAQVVHGYDWHHPAPTAWSLRQSSIPFMGCDICGRPVKGGCILIAGMAVGDEIFAPTIHGLSGHRDCLIRAHNDPALVNRIDACNEARSVYLPDGSRRNAEVVA